jgi:uncharacterized metal-binding protein YceD (DUF177 family)
MNYLKAGSKHNSSDLHGSSEEKGKDDDTDIDPRWNALKDLK